jgi:NAD+ synthase (glutamine-hydrolysing)
MPRLRVAAAQIDLVVGDLDGNSARILAAYERAEEAGCDLVAFPEMSVTGYPPEDLLLRPAFVAEAGEAVRRIAERTGRTAAIIGFPEIGRDLYNAAAVCAHGTVVGTYRKHLLPNYAVFDEQRYFTPGDDVGPLFVIGGVRVGISICEDAWSPVGPITHQAAGGAELAVNINGSPFYAGRMAERETMLATRAADASIPIVYCNLVGGQDELVFDGGSLVFDETGHLVARARQLAEDLLVVDLDVRPAFRKRLLDPRGRPSATPLAEIDVSPERAAEGGPLPARVEPLLDDDDEIYEALVLGTRDYMHKQGFTDAVIAISGGIDSALVAVIAADALGPDHVTGVLMPSRFSSTGSVTDAEALASNLGIATLTIPIEPAHTAFEAMLAEAFTGTTPGLTEENIQSRARGVTLMALSNKFGWIVLTTGNKSEMAVGYATIYGDMAGGYAVIKDVVKTRVFRLCEARNRRAGFELIPRAIIDKPPSAELRPDQRDDDSLPPYEKLDPILIGYIEHDLSIAELIAAGHDPDTVRRVVGLVDRAEYKRRQAPPGVRVTARAFGRDRRMPITDRWPRSPA